MRASRKYYYKNLEKVRQRGRDWARNNPDKNAARAAQHRAKKRNSGGRGISVDDRALVLISTLGLCSYCGERKDLVLDHIVPLARNGEHDVENAAPACDGCNSQKSDTPLLVWLARKALSRAA